MASVSEPQDWNMNDAQFVGYIADLPEEVFEDKPVKIDFKKLFKLKLTRERYIKSLESISSITTSKLPICPTIWVTTRSCVSFRNCLPPFSTSAPRIFFPMTVSASNFIVTT